jgi:hypothetical protein
MSIFPLVILRTSEKNSIDVIICFDEITPIRKNKSSSRLKDAYLIETVYIKNLSHSTDELCNLELKLNLFPGSTYYSVYANFLNDIYELEFTYLKNLSKYFEHFKVSEDLQLDIKSEVKKILVFKYDDIFRPMNKSNIFYGYLGIEKVYDSFLLVSFLNSKIFVKEYNLENEEDDQGSEMKKDAYDLRKLEQNIHRLYNDSKEDAANFRSKANFQKIGISASKA